MTMFRYHLAMALDPRLREQLDAYARSDLAGDLDAHIKFFDFLDDDPELQRRLGEEYFTARYIYKFFEGMRIDEDWARRAQIQLQVQQYASIYEACIHHLLFECASGHPDVLRLLRVDTLKPWSVSTELQARLAAVKADNGRTVTAAIKSTISLGAEKVRFDSKVRAAAAIGMIEHDLAVEMVSFYSARNMIHIHAELKKGADWSWEIDFARKAYWRLEKFALQARAWRSSIAAERLEAP